MKDMETRTCEQVSSELEKWGGSDRGRLGRRVSEKTYRKYPVETGLDLIRFGW